MNTTEQQKHFDTMVETMRGILIKKGNDYSNADRLSNFKNAGAIIGITPEQHCLALIATKVARLGNLLSTGKIPDNESVDDSIVDMANYSLLLSMLVADRRNDEKQTVISELQTVKQRVRETLMVVPDSKEVVAESAPPQNYGDENLPF